MAGRVLRFDSVRGYGFIQPDKGGEDVFLHVNDLLDDKHLIRPGTIVEFDVEPGDRGLKASGVQIVGQPEVRAANRTDMTAVSNGFAAGSRPVQVRGSVSDDEDVLSDVLSRQEFLREVTEMMLRIEPVLDARQILAIREAMVRSAVGHSWVED